MMKQTPIIDLFLTQPQNNQQQKIHPKQARIFLSLGKVLAKKGEWKEAIAAYCQGIKADQNFAEVYHCLGDALVETGEKEEAIKVYQRAIEIDEKLWEVHHKLGNLLQERGELEEAVAAYKKSIELKSDFCWSHNNLGDVLVKLERWEEAVGVYRRAIELNPDFPWAYYKLGDVLVKLGEWDGAVKAYRCAIEIKSDMPRVHEKLADALQHYNKLTSQEIINSYYQAIEENPDDIQIYYKALEYDPKNPKLYSKLGQVLVEKEKLEQAIIFYNKALQICDDAETYWLLGNALLKYNQPERAYETCLKAININPDYLEAYYTALEVKSDDYKLYGQLGDAYLRQNQFHHAIIFYKIALKFHPNDAKINLKIGDVLAKKSNYDRALIYYRYASKIESECYESYQKQAEILTKLVNFQDALAMYLRAYELKNKELEKQGKLSQAILMYRRALNSNCLCGNEFNGRVLFALNSSLPYDPSGYVIRSQMILKSLSREGIDVVAVTKPGYPESSKHDDEPLKEQEEIDGIKYFRIPPVDANLSTGNAYIENYSDQIVEISQKHQASVIHSASNFKNGLASILAAKKLGIFSIYEVRGLWHLSRLAKEAEYHQTDDFAYEQEMEIKAVRDADAVVTISEALRDDIARWGINQDKITVIPNAVDLDKFTPREPDLDLKRELGLEGQYVIGFLGSLTEYEGIDLIIKAVTSLVAEGVQLSILVVGEGYAREKLEVLAKLTPEGKNIVFTGHVPFEEVNRYYSIFDLCPFSRKGYEVCKLVPPLKLLEVMAMAKPAIVSDLPPLLEMVEDGKTGLVCRADDVESLKRAILRLHHDLEYAKQLGIAARKWVEKYRSWEQVCQRYLTVYYRLGK